MAGIGFSLRKILKHDTLFHTAQAYSYAGILGAGPWLISIIGIFGLDFLKYTETIHARSVDQFQVSVTYLIALSLIFSGLVQHSFTRYVADRIYENRFHRIIPNYFGLLFLVFLVGGLVVYPISSFLLQGESFLYQILMSANFVILSGIWLTSNLLSGIKRYQAILFAFLMGYGLTVLIGYLLRGFGLDGLMLGFCIGQFVLLVFMIGILIYNYPVRRLIEFDFLRRNKLFVSLIFTGLFYNLGIWADKFIFWFYPYTSEYIIGPLRASMIYDVPIFLAYIAIIPGMAIFLFRMETDFAEYYQRYYDAIRDGGSLNHILGIKGEMIDTARNGILDIFKVQSLMVLVSFAVGPIVLGWMGISKHYAYLLNIDLVGTGLLVVFLGLLNILFYLDRRIKALVLTLLFFILNVIFTLITLHLGVFYFGYGFVLALLIVNVLAFLGLDWDFEHLEYITFMEGLR